MRAGAESTMAGTLRKTWHRRRMAVLRDSSPQAIDTARCFSNASATRIFSGQVVALRSPTHARTPSSPRLRGGEGGAHLSDPHAKRLPRPATKAEPLPHRKGCHASLSRFAFLADMVAHTLELARGRISVTLAALRCLVRRTPPPSNPIKFRLWVLSSSSQNPIEPLKDGRVRDANMQPSPHKSGAPTSKTT